MRALLAFVAALPLCTPALAGDLSLGVRDAAGRPVRDVVRGDVSARAAVR